MFRKHKLYIGTWYGNTTGIYIVYTYRCIYKECGIHGGRLLTYYREHYVNKNKLFRNIRGKEVKRKPFDTRQHRPGG